LPAAAPYPAGKGSATIRRTMLPNRGRVSNSAVSRSRLSLDGMRSEVARDPSKSTFREALKESWILMMKPIRGFVSRVENRNVE
jgi:hypothetical protein